MNQIVIDAIERHKQIKFNYTNENGKNSVRVVSPYTYGVINYKSGDTIIIKGFENKGGSGEHFTTFKLKNIYGSIELLEDDVIFTKPLKESISDTTWVRVYAKYEEFPIIENNLQLRTENQ
jgi:predicted DNA-binding transcriptional regulator YafY